MIDVDNESGHSNSKRAVGNSFLLHPRLRVNNVDHSSQRVDIVLEKAVKVVFDDFEVRYLTDVDEQLERGGRRDDEDEDAPQETFSEFHQIPLAGERSLISKLLAVNSVAHRL
ncbi:hypothetical protein E1B28_010920 [Marasmius oreades]|uniref:Uncharacterized protein n=1 Tax=Marasmius oreades TaxID=181124 RepID=A0A9P7RT24_9AGAR|nr:uncharacterized protein E1B28_010920 [Marasmius oreades]KAG7089219.1 hypothetical protein E1B28_010920 [Marasmius oreades]